ncbi:hypothetical protein KM043_000280 [Ampulex compressa]|nr:hypothetical protein KM043_000280 [Ampulex compressa]
MEGCAGSIPDRFPGDRGTTPRLDARQERWIRRSATFDALSHAQLSIMFHNVMSRTLNSTGRLSVRFFSTPATREAPSIEKTLNQVTLLGRVGAEPQQRGSSDHPVVIFSLATHTNYKYDNGEYVQRTDWHKVCVFRPYLRESVFHHLKKGQRVLINGRLTYGEFKDDEGNSKPSTAIVAEDVIFFQT